MRRTCLALMAAGLVGMPSTSFADTVVLKDGQRFDGVVEETDDEVRVELDVGTIAFARSEVASIERAETPIHEFERRLSAVDVQDPAALQRLAVWAEQAGLPTRSDALHQRVLGIEPNNERSRFALGHVKRGDAWVDPAVEALAQRSAARSAMAQALRAESKEQAPQIIIYDVSSPASAGLTNRDDDFRTSMWGWWYPANPLPVGRQAYRRARAQQGRNGIGRPSRGYGVGRRVQATREGRRRSRAGRSAAPSGGRRGGARGGGPRPRVR